MDRIHLGQRVLYGDFGEGTVVKMNEDLTHVSVAFSEVETLELPATLLEPLETN